MDLLQAISVLLRGFIPPTLLLQDRLLEDIQTPMMDGHFTREDLQIRLLLEQLKVARSSKLILTLFKQINGIMLLRSEKVLQYLFT